MAQFHGFGFPGFLAYFRTVMQVGNSMMLEQPWLHEAELLIRWMSALRRSSRVAGLSVKWPNRPGRARTYRKRLVFREVRHLVHAKACFRQPQSVKQANHAEQSKLNESPRAGETECPSSPDAVF